MSEKHFMGAEDLEFVNVQPPTTLNSQTNVIISSYENKVSQNIATKTIAAAKQGKTPDFTKEELLYLNKKASENADTELNVITPIPTITLKKGKTELNIKNATALFKKMEKKYPTIVSSSQDLQSVNGIDNHTGEEVYISPSNPAYIPPNRNAYEIRTDILTKALEWVQYKKQMENNIGGKIPTEEDVLAVAQKFYKFVENKR